MGISAIIRRILGRASFPLRQGHELPDPVVGVPIPSPIADDREKVQWRKPASSPNQPHS